MPDDPADKSPAKLVSIQIGEPKPSPGSTTGVTSIDKQPVASVEIANGGLVGDTISDLDNHGGADQAVYLYTTEDYEYWQNELGRELSGGAFGENLTISGLSSADIAVGDRFAIGSVMLEATSARIPCGTFQTHLGIENWVARFREARRPGAYCRVIRGGAVEPGASVEHIAASDTVSILETQDLYYDTKASVDRIQAALESPVARRNRELLERRLAKAQE